MASFSLSSHSLHASVPFQGCVLIAALAVFAKTPTIDQAIAQAASEGSALWQGKENFDNSSLCDLIFFS